MNKIIDPSLLTLRKYKHSIGDIYINTSTKLIDIKLTQGDKVSIQTLYSFLMMQWRLSKEFYMYAFPMMSITNEMFEFINGWNITDTSIKYLADGGWAVTDNQGNTIEEWMNLTSLGDINPIATVYYTINGDRRTELGKGCINQAIKIYAKEDKIDPEIVARFSFDVDWRNDEFEFCVDYVDVFSGPTTDSYNLNVEQNIPTLTYRRYMVPLST